MPENSPEKNVFQIFVYKVMMVFKSIYVTTFLFFKNLPAVAKNRWMRYRNEKKRTPKRKTKSRVYILVGYTTKAKVDKRYRSVRIQRVFRGLLISGIFIISCVLMYRAISPQLDFESYSQMFGIKELDELTNVDPFESFHLSE